MFKSSVFIFLMMRALYRMVCKNWKTFFAKKSLNVPNVKLLSKFYFNIFGFFMPFWWEWQLALYILSDFPAINNQSGLNDLNGLNNLNGFNDLCRFISSKNLYFKVNMYIFDGLLLFITWKRPLKVILNQFTLPF